MIERGEAEFFFVANDATPAVLEHLRQRNYAHVVNVNEPLNDTELFALGYGAPEYMSRVYRGYNDGVRRARGNQVVLINSDNYFSPDWLENLLKYSDRTRVISCKLVERMHPTFTVFPGALRGEFGENAETFDEPGFLSFAARVRKTGLERGGAYMPALFHTDVLIEAGLFPCGNLAGGSFDQVARYGDEAFFGVLAAMGVSHFTALDSIAYHLKEGERADAPVDGRGLAVEEPSADLERPLTPVVRFPGPRAVERVVDAVPPSKEHGALIGRLLRDADDYPAVTTLRHILASGSLTPDQERQVRAELKAMEEANALSEQARKVTKLVERVVGRTGSRPILRALKATTRFTRPIRGAIARRMVSGRGR